MKVVGAQQIDDVRAEVRSRFAEFNRTSSPSKGRKYPKSLKTLVCRALAEGVDLSSLKGLTGVSPSALLRWNQSEKVARQTPARKPRRLAVVGGEFPEHHRPIVVRLPSGISIELGNIAELSSEFLTSLATLGGSCATAR
jgi:hypothetical protein